MRQLKYIKLFEAFDSVQIAKTLKFVKKSDKSKFMDALNAITNNIDAPLSSLNDDNFQYLPFKKAISLRNSSDKVNCGECNGVGKVTKAWGSGTRNIKCTKCNGEGTVDAKPKLKYFKFWFNSDGSFIGTTAIDGLYHINKSDVKNFEKKDVTEDFKTLSVPEIKSKYKLVNGVTKFYVENVRVYRGTKSCLGTSFIDRDGGLFVVNDSVDTHSMPAGRKYKEFGHYAVDVKRSLNDERNDDTLKIYMVSDVEEKEDIFWNVPVSFWRSGDGWSLDKNMSKEFLKDAHFAIVFDFDSFAYSGKGWNPVSITQQDRSTAREGATALMSNDDIKTANIDRYVKTLANVDLGEGLTRLVNKIPKIFGGEFALYYIYDEKNFSKFKNMLSDVYNFMSTEDDETRSYYNNKIRDRVLDTFSDCDELNRKIAKRLEFVKEDIAERDALVDLIKVVNKLEEVSKRINQKLLKGKIETVEDMEIMLMKAEGIKAALKSDRFEIDYYIKNYLEYLPYTGWRGDNAALDSIKNLSISDIPKNLRKLDQLISLIDRL